MMSKRERDIKRAQKIYLKCRQIKEDLIYIQKLARESMLMVETDIMKMNITNHRIHDKARDMERQLDENQTEMDEELRGHTALTQSENYD